MRLTRLDRLFRLSLGTDEGVPRMRKGAGHFDSINASLALSYGELAARSVFVSDSVHDMQVEQEAGVVAVGRVTADNRDVLQQAGVEYLIRDLREMPVLLATL